MRARLQFQFFPQCNYYVENTFGEKNFFFSRILDKASTKKTFTCPEAIVNELHLIIGWGISQMSYFQYNTVLIRTRNLIDNKSLMYDTTREPELEAFWTGREWTLPCNLYCIPIWFSYGFILFVIIGCARNFYLPLS